MLQASFGKFTAVAIDAAAIHPLRPQHGQLHYECPALARVLQAPKIARKNTKAAAGEATEVAAKARASVRMEEIKRIQNIYLT